MMAKLVFILCALTSLTCATMLFRSYLTNKGRLLLWSGLCFTGLTLNNTLLVIDLIILPSSVDFSTYRAIPALVGLIVLIYGLIWEAT